MKKSEQIWFFISGLILLIIGIVKLLEHFPIIILLWLFGLAFVLGILGFYLDRERNRN